MRIIQLSIVALITSMLSLSTAKAQNADEIVKKHIEAIGGIENWKKVQSVKMVGSINAQGQELTITRTVVQDKAFRMDMTIAGMENYQIVTTTEGWNYFPVGGQTKPEAMTADEVKESAIELDIQGPLVNYKEKGITITYLGKDDIEGTECYKLKITYKDGKETTMCFDASNYYLIREVQKLKANGKEMQVTMNFSNFKKMDIGILMPMTLGTDQGNITLKTIEINPKLDESTFKPKS
jgi:outer membrane lipoprotein-sorting protein